MATEVVLPMLGITVERGKIIEWEKREGDHVEKGEIIFIVEVEKATTEVESPASGILAKILIPKGIEVPVLTVVGVITESGEELPAKYRAPASEVVSIEAQAEVVSTTAYRLVPAVPGPTGEDPTALPAARRLAGKLGLDLTKINGTGPGGVILLKDVEAARVGAPESKTAKISTLPGKAADREGLPLAQVSGTGVPGRLMGADMERTEEEAAGPGLGKVIPMSTMRRVIARRMSDSASSAPHIYLFTDVWMEPLLLFREEILADFEEKFNLRPSINDFLIKAVALSIVDFPLLNATLRDEAIHILPRVNVCLAVALPDGLVAPAIADADRAGLVAIAGQRRDLVQRAVAGKLTPDELESGTFTVSSLAQSEIVHFTSILNPPQSGILSVAKIREELTLVDREVKVKKVATFGLAVDHRIIDGAMAADFLQSLKAKLERPRFTFLTL